MRVLIGEDEALLRDGLCALLERNGFQVIGATDNADELLRLATAQTPQLTVTDIRMPPRNADDGLQAAIQIRTERPDAAIVVLSQHVQRRYATELIGDRPNGVGYLLKQRIADTETFCRDLHRVADGGTVLDPDIVAAMLDRAQRDQHGIDRLTPRQREVLALIAQGRSNTAIARRLSITDKAVVQHTSRIYDQLDLPHTHDDHRRVLAVIHYLNH